MGGAADATLASLVRAQGDGERLCVDGFLILVEADADDAVDAHWGEAEIALVGEGPRAGVALCGGEDEVDHARRRRRRRRRGARRRRGDGAGGGGREEEEEKKEEEFTWESIFKGQRMNRIEKQDAALMEPPPVLRCRLFLLQKSHKFHKYSPGRRRRAADASCPRRRPQHRRRRWPRRARCSDDGDLSHLALSVSGKSHRAPGVLLLPRIHMPHRVTPRLSVTCFDRVTLPHLPCAIKPLASAPGPVRIGPDQVRSG